MIKLVIFDLDGTLVNAYPAVAKSVNYTLKVLGLAPRSPAEIKRSVGEGDRRLVMKFVGPKSGRCRAGDLQAASCESFKGQRQGAVFARGVRDFKIFEKPWV